VELSGQVIRGGRADRGETRLVGFRAPCQEVSVPIGTTKTPSDRR
jgi:hypothetical protein